MPPSRTLRLVAVLAGFAAAGFIVVWLILSPPSVPVARSDPARPPEAAPVAHLEYAATPLGSPVGEFERPLVTHVDIVDLDGDGLSDVIYCEGRNNTVRWIRQSPLGVFIEQVIGENLAGPVRVSTADINGRGRLDVLVACMGQITPNNDRIGSVVVLENLDNKQFRPRVLLNRTARVTDVRAANLSSHTDGRLDLVVGQFGYAQGETRWMKNMGGWQFESRIVNTLSGCVHTPVADFDGDGLPDFAALISQEWEEVHLFRNLGGDQFQHTLVWGSTNEDYGSSGLAVADLNRDGRPDLLYTNGDGFDYAGYGTRSWHGVQWLENRGGGRFQFHRIGDMPGAYSPCAADLDGDGTLDILTVSGFADWTSPDSVSMMAWLNDGRQNFSPVVLANTPIKLVTAAVGDLDGDGVPEIVTGGFHVYPPFEHMSSVTLWRRQ